MSIKYKVITLFLTVIFIPLNLLGMITYYEYSNTLEDQTYTYTSQISDQINQNINQLIEELHRMTMLPLYDQDVLDLLKKHEAEESYYYPSHDEIDKMRSFISTLVYDRNEINGIQIITNNNSIFSNLGSSRVLTRYHNMEQDLWYKKITEANGKSVLISTHTPSYYFNEQEQVFSVGKVIRDLDTFEHIGIIKIDIRLDYIKELLDETHFSEGALVLLVDKDQNFIYQQMQNQQEMSKSNLLLNDKEAYSFDDNQLFREELNEIMAKVENDEQSKDIINYNGKNYLPIVRNSINSEIHSVVLIPEEEILEASRSHRIFTILLISFCMVITLILAIIVTQKITGPIYRLRDKMLLAEGGNFDQRVETKSKDEIGELSDGFNRMMEKINQLIHQVYQTEIREKDAEIKALQSQINPHFIYNTLESINMMAIIDGKYGISDMVSSLGKLIRYTVDQKTSLIKIKEDLDFVSSYVKIQQQRYEDRLEISIDFPPDIMEAMIPKLTLQPIIENAIVHGLDTGNIYGKITVTGWRDNGHLYIRVRDNGKGIAPEVQAKLKEKLNGIDFSEKNNKHSGVALKNIHERIQLLFGKDFGLNVTSKMDVGTDVVVVLPYSLNKLEGENDV